MFEERSEEAGVGEKQEVRWEMSGAVRSRGCRALCTIVRTLAFNRKRMLLDGSEYSVN